MADTKTDFHQDSPVEDIREKPLSGFEQDVLSHAPRMRGRQLTAALAFVAGTGFTLFG